MSLDIYLKIDESVTKSGSGIFIRENGQNKELSLSEARKRYPELVIQEQVSETSYVYSDNITHNLGKMAKAASVYKPLWHPDEINITHARQLIEPLQTGLELLKSDRERFEQFNPSNRWGDYDGLVSFVENYLAACDEWPNAKIRVSR